MSTNATGTGPLHGYRGIARPVGPSPCGFVVGLNRQAGARGSSIATEVSARLGWPLYTPEMVDFLGRDEAAQQELLAGVSPTHQLWVDYQLQELIKLRNLSPDSDSLAVARMVYTLAVRGRAVIIGRAAGFLLPPESTLHVRIVAPVAERVAYLGQWLRLTEPEAIEEMKSRDANRAAFLKPFTDKQPDDIMNYDLVINSGRFSVTSSAELIVLAAEMKLKAFQAVPDSVEGEPV